MKKFVKSISLFLMIATVIMSVAGCGNGSFSTTADAGEICCFCTDTYDILAGESADVKFTAHIEASQKPETLELYEEDVVISKMYDDGTNGDDNANDDVYTCTVSLSQQSRCALEYYPAYGSVKGKSVEISYYKELSEKEAESVCTAVANINAITDYDSALDFMNSSADIESFESNDTDNTISYTTVYGVSGYWGYAEETDSYKAAGANSVPVSEGVNYTTAAANAKKITSAPAISSPSVSVARPYRGTEFQYDDFSEAGTLIADTLNGTVTVADDGEANIEFFKSLGNYDVTLIDSHGAFTYDTPYICTGETFNLKNFLLNAEGKGMGDYVSKRIIVVSGDRLGIGPGFFDKYYEDNSLNGKMIFLGICSGARNDKLANSLIGKGADAVAGYTRDVGVGYCNDTLFECFVNSMLLSETTLEAGVDSAVDVYGPAMRNRGYCELVYFGNGDYCFYNHGGNTSAEALNQQVSTPAVEQSNNTYVTDFTVEDELLMNIGELALIEPEFTPAEADNYTISWTSSDPDVATVSPTGEAGIISSHSLGTTTITAELVSGDNKLTRTTLVRVTPKARDTILVLDISGSMYGEPLTEMKEAAIQFCNDLLKDDYNNRVGLVFFDSSSVSYDLTDDLDYLVDVIEAVDTGGLTNMYDGLSTADYMMETYGREEAIKNIVIMADGVPNEGVTSYSGSSSENITTGDTFSYYFKYTDAIVDLAEDMMNDYNLYSLGFFHAMYGEEVTFVSEFMAQLTNMEDGYHQVDKAEDLQFAFGDITEEISSGSKIIINIACPVDVMVRYGSETLSSASADFNDTTSFGSLQLLGKKQDKKVVSLDADKVYDIELTGTDEGTMNYSVNYFDNDEKIVDYRSFEEVPISSTTIITSSTDNSVEDVELEVDIEGDGVIDIIYSAAANSTGAITMDTRDNGMDLPVWAIILIVCGVLLVSGGVLAIILVTTSINRRNRAAEVPYVAPEVYPEPPLKYDEDVITEDDAPHYVTPAGNCGAITVETGSMGGFRVPVGEGQIIHIGTGGKYSHLVLDHHDYPNVSRLHCTVSYVNGMYYVVDCSTNGTYLNSGKRLEKGKRTPVRPQTVLILANKQCMIYLD